MEKIRVLIGMMGLDQHEAGAIGISRILRDAGMEVVYAGRFNSSSMIVQTALQEDVDVIGISFHSWDYFYYVPQLHTMLQEQDLTIPIIVGGSVITGPDAHKLREIGAVDAFCPSDSRETIVTRIEKLVLEHRQLHAHAKSTKTCTNKSAPD